MSACSNTASLINGTIEATASPVLCSLKDFPHSGASLFKIDHIGGAIVRSRSQKRSKSQAPHPLLAPVEPLRHSVRRSYLVAIGGEADMTMGISL